MQLWLYLSVLSVVCGCVLSWLKTRRARGMLRGLPMYSSLPIVGSALHLIGKDGVALFRLLHDTTKMFEQHNKPIVFWAGTVPLILVSDMDDIKLITNTFIEKPYYYNFAKIWLGEGLITATGEIWKRNIKNLSNLFSKSVVDNFLPIFNEQAANLVQDLTEFCDGPPVDVMKTLCKNTLEAICKTALGVDSMVEDGDSYYKAFDRTLDLLVERSINILVHLDWMYKLTPSYNELKNCVNVLHGVSNKVLQKRKLHREMMKRNGIDTDSEFKAVIDILLELGSEDPRLSSEQIRAEVDTMIAAGHETVATTTFYVLQMLGRHPRVQEELFKEMQHIFGRSSRPATRGDISRMVYCEGVINETMRLLPSVPAVLRHADTDANIKHCTIPAGSTIAISAWSVGRSTRVWGADALQFKPERWLGESPPAAAFLPFSYGKRACIGKRYAMVLMKTLVSQCVRELQFHSSGAPLAFKVDPVLRPVGGHFIQITRRTHSTI